LAWSVATPSGLQGRPEIGTDISPGTAKAEARAGTEMPAISPNQIPPASTPQHLQLDYQPPPTPPNIANEEKTMFTVVWLGLGLG